MRLTIVASHPVQYQAPFYRALARRLDLTVLYAYSATPQDQAIAGFGVAFDWDVDLTGGYDHVFLENVSRAPVLKHFGGCDTPGVGHELRRLAPDAVLLMGWHLKSYWQAIWAARRAGIPVMVRGDSHLETPRSSLKRAGKAVVYPIALRVFDAALYVGEKSRRYWEHYRFPAARQFFSPHCIDNDWFAARATREERERLRVAHGISDDTAVALFAGKLVPFKRPLDLIEAAAIARAAGRNVGVMVAGAGELDQAMCNLALARQVPLHMLGFRNQSEMPAAYAASDMVVLPSDSETWGLVANEALACGRPIIISDACGCAADLAADGHVGRAFPMGDVEAFARAVTATLLTRPSAEEIAEVSGRYSIAAASDGVIAAMIASRAPSGGQREVKAR
jgi:glycosyltransferase involved in cell wall biosynthesis